MKYNTLIFIEKSIAVHGNLYDYSKVQFTNVDIPVIVIDPDYGEFSVHTVTMNTVLHHPLI